VSEARLPVCLNCGSPLSGPFCAGCGQRDVPPYPSVRELAVDAVSEFSGWDGRLAQTLRTLVRHPGVLTREFLEGRRARYISPLRVYLTASLVYFVLAASAPEVRLESGKILGLRVGATAKDDPNPMSRADRVGASASRALETGDALTAAERAAALEDISRAPALMQPFLRRSVEDPGGLKRRILETMPRMLFVLLPIFAGILALFYRGRKYPEHLYFAIHLHAFIFLALAVSELLKFTQSVLLVSGASLIALISIPIYATLAFRRVYGGSLARTLLKEVAIAAIYALTAAGGFITTIYWVSVAT
jgi:hypothetical protein